MAIFHRSLMKKKILGAVWTQIKQRILHVFELGHLPHCPSYPEVAQDDRIGRHLQLAILDQARIGWINFLKGRISQHWGKAQGIYYSEAFPESKTLVDNEHNSSAGMNPLRPFCRDSCSTGMRYRTASRPDTHAWPGHILSISASDEPQAHI